MTTPLPEVLTLKEAATYLRCSPRHARELASTGVLPTFRLTDTGPRLVRLEDLRATVARRVAEQMATLPIDPLADAAD